MSNIIRITSESGQVNDVNLVIGATFSIQPQTTIEILTDNINTLTYQVLGSELDLTSIVENDTVIAVTLVDGDLVLSDSETGEVLSTVEGQTELSVLVMETPLDGNDVLGTDAGESRVGTGEADDVYGLGGDDVLRGFDGDDLLAGGSGNDSIDGGTGNDRIYGGDGVDRLLGRDGQDVIYGGAGADSLYGQNGDDTLYGGLGGDLVYGGAGLDLIDGGEGNDRLYGEDGQDTMFGGDGHDVVSGGNDNDVLSGGLGNDTLNGGSGNDVLSGNEDDDRLWGEVGDDTLFGGAGQDHMDGGRGLDVLYGDEGLDTLYGRDGNDVLYGGDDADKLYGDGDNDELFGGADDDFLHGGEGDDLLVGGAGNDNLLGSNGNDRLYGDTHDGSAVDTSQGNADELKGLDGDDSLFGGVGNDKLIGGNDNDELHGDAGDDTLYGGAGLDTLYGGQGVDNLQGGNGNDILSGGDDADRLDGGAGADLLQGDDGDDAIYARDGDDTLHGGLGADFLSGEKGRDVLYGDEGVDYLAGGDDDDVLHGGDDADNLLGGSGADQLNGDDGDDTLNGGDGNDIVHGGAGNDRVLGNNNNDSLYGDAGADSLYGGAGIDLVVGGAGNDRLYGEDGNDVMYGDAHDGSAVDTSEGNNDSLYGGLGDDTLFGGIGDDRLDGDEGHDVLKGDEGADRLFGGVGDDTLSGGAGNDIIYSGEGANTLLFERGGDQDTFYTSSEAGTSNVIIFGENITYDQLWFEKVKQNLQISIIGTEDSVVVSNWFSATKVNTVTGISTNLGNTLPADQVNALVTAMAQQTKPGLGETELSPELQAALMGDINQSWGIVTQVQSSAPVLLGLDSDTVAENVEGAALGNVAIDDPYSDGTTTYTYAVSDDRFEISATGALSLKAGVSLDYEFEPTVSLDVTVTSSSGRSYNQDFVVNVTDGDDIAALGSNYFVDTLTSGYSWTGGAGQALTITYNFLTTDDIPTYLSNHSYMDTFVAYTEVQKTGFLQAMQTWSDYANITFVEAADANSADMNFGTTNVGANIGAFAYYPGSGLGGDVFFNNYYASYFTRFNEGTWAYETAIHEIGHALGLKHPGNYNAGGGGTDGPYLPTDEDNSSNTVMSYYEEGGYKSTPMIYDVAAIQYMYGINTSTNAGDTTYYATDSHNDWLIWDGSGIDTFDVSSDSSGAVVDLTPGNLTEAYDGHSNVHIAYGSVIENIVAGSGGDTLTGNDAANEINAGGGADIVSGGYGDDILIGGAGADQLYGEYGQDTLIGGEGNDQLSGGAGNDTADYSTSTSGVVVDLGLNTADDGFGFTDTLALIENVVGSDFADTLVGDSGHNELTGGAGDDVLYGGDGADSFVFLQGDTSVDTIMDFSFDDGDILDIADLLTDYLGDTSTIGEFVQIVNQNGDAQINVDADGQGDGFKTVAVVDGYTITDSVETLVDNQVLIVT